MAIDLRERLRKSEESRRRAWRVLQDLRAVLEVLSDRPIPREGEKRFRAEGDRLIKALAQSLECFRSSIHRLETALQVAQDALARHGHHEELRASQLAAMHVQGQYGLTQEQIDQRRCRLKELRALPEEPEPPHMDYHSSQQSVQVGLNRPPSCKAVAGSSGEADQSSLSSEPKAGLRRSESDADGL